MKLHPATVTFTEVDSRPAITYTVPGTEYSVTLAAQPDGHNVVTTVTPVQYNNPETCVGDMPEELEMLLAQSHLQAPHIAAYLANPSTEARVTASLAHESVEKSKVLTPFLVEEIIVAQIYALSTGVPLKKVILMGLGSDEVTGSPNEVEKEIIAASKAQEDSVMDRHAKERDRLVLPFQAIIPALTDAERASCAQPNPFQP